MKDKIFVALIIDWKKGVYESYLVNPTEKHYKQVLAYTGAYCTCDEDLIQTTSAVKELGELRPYSWVLIEDSDVDEFDFVIWYWLDLFPLAEDMPIEKVSFHFPKYALCYDKKKEYLPVIEKIGQCIEVETRSDSKTIEEAIIVHAQDKRIPGIIDRRLEKGDGHGKTA